MSFSTLKAKFFKLSASLIAKGRICKCPSCFAGSKLSHQDLVSSDSLTQPISHAWGSRPNGLGTISDRLSTVIEVTNLTRGSPSVAQDTVHPLFFILGKALSSIEMVIPSTR